MIMEDSTLRFLEPYVFKFLIFHIIVSAILAFFISLYVLKRFIKDSEAIRKKDAKRLQEVAANSLLFRLLFEASLHKYNQINAFLFIFLFNMAVPIIGYGASLWLGWYMVHIEYEKKVVQTGLIDLGEFSTSFLSVERVFGEGSMKELMQNEYAPKKKKLRALTTLANNISPQNIEIIKQTLSSKDDEIRMFGYSIINKKEKRLNDSITKNLQLFKESTEKEKKAYAAKELAFSYWEMVYTGLIQESLHDDFLQEVKKYLEFAKKFYVQKVQQLEKEHADIVTIDSYNDTRVKLYVLSGRVHMSQKLYEEAANEFTMAQEFNESNTSFVLPYLAEVHFILGNYKTVYSILNSAKDLELNATLNPIVEQWNREKEGVA